MIFLEHNLNPVLQVESGVTVYKTKLKTVFG